MRNKNKVLFLVLSIILGLFYVVDIKADSSIFSATQLEGDTTNSYSGHTFIYTLNGKSYLAEYITEEKVEDMKRDISNDNTRDNVDHIINSHGTGYLTPTEEDLDSLIGKISLLELISDYEQGYMATADISTETYFPTVGDQGMQGSCTSWANVYYAFGYLEAKDYGWDASSGNPQYLLSPAWSYNKIAAYDYGSVPSETAQLIKEWGVSTLNTMPYDDTDVDSWGDEAAWREAPYHKPLDYTLISYVGYATIDVIKSLLDGGTPVTFGLDAYQYSNGINEGTSDFILSSDEYDPSGSLNHANCFVGYDDSISEGSDVGAFRVVNSWGESWGDNGFYWLTYDAFNEFGAASGQQILYLTDRIDYNPNIIATWEFSNAPTRMSDIISLGVGPHNSPLDILVPHYDADVNNLFPEFMAFDLTDFYSYYTIDNDIFFYLEIGLADTAGTISSFKLERYASGILQEISQESPDTPKDTPGYVNATFMILTHELKVRLTTPINPIIYNSYSIEALIMNNGASTETSVNLDLLLNGAPVDSFVIPSFPSGANATINYLWTPTAYDIYNFTAYAAPVPGETYLSNNEYSQILYILGPIFFDDFESGLSKWVSSTGLWHLTDESSAWPDPYHSPTHSMWFGNESTGDYDTGYRETGDLISTPINLVSTDFASLEFYHWREGEGSGYDESLIYISTNGVDWDLIYGNYESYIAPWEKVSVDISAYVGNPSVQLRFTFDTYDDIMNDYRGWLIDDVGIMGTGVVIPHNLRVMLEVPENPELSKSYDINATVTNIGSSDETSINLFLYENGLLIDSLYIANLLSGSSQTINYFWMPTSYGDYNFSAFAPPVSGEEITYDNFVTKIVPLHEVILFDGMYINYSFNLANIYIGQTQVSYTQLSGSKFHTLWEGILSGMPLTNHWDVDTQTRVMENGDGNFYFGDNHHTPIWIFTDISISDIVYIAADGEGDHAFLVSGDIIYDIPDFGPVEAWVLEDLSLPGGIAYYEKSTGVLLKGTFCYVGGMFNYTFDLTQTNVLFNRLVFDHDLRVNLGTPSYCEIYNTYTISATIINTGTNDETGVDLFLYLDGVIIDSVHISSLASGSSQTIDYSWTPMNYGVYNFSAYAPPVVGETYTSDNTKIKIIHLHKITLFDGMFLNYSFTLWGASYPLEFLYSDVSDSIFHVDYSLYPGGPPQTGYWDVDSQTRVMSNSYGGISFGSGTHTPLWIFTDTSLNDVITIAVDAEGDHSFTVSNEITYYIPGFGSVNAWVLEDLDGSGGIALYEKITGILLNGTFFFGGGAYNYSFELINTNAFVKSLTVAFPDSSSSCAGGTSEDICWTSQGLISNVKIELYKDDAFVMVISSNTPNDGVYAWAIPSNLATSDKYQIKISDVADPLISDFSEYFEIKSAGEGEISGYNIIFFITMLGVFSLIVALRKRKRSLSKF
ncbi:MAG: CARDB domain-containing protein [Candidatus Thorarchaeota archaeon]